jgi:hypothetical protein
MIKLGIKDLFLLNFFFVQFRRKKEEIVVLANGKFVRIKRSMM